MNRESVVLVHANFPREKFFAVDKRAHALDDGVEHLCEGAGEQSPV